MWDFASLFGNIFNSFASTIGGATPKSASDTYQGVFGGGTVAPTVDNSGGLLDAAATQMGQGMSRGRTSTMLTGGAGEDESMLNTSKILLGR